MSETQRLRVWLGPLLIRVLEGEAERADKCAETMPSRLYGLCVDVDDPVPGGTLSRLPADDAQWPLAVK